MHVIQNETGSRRPPAGNVLPKAVALRSVLVLGAKPAVLPNVLCHSDPHQPSTLIVLADTIRPFDLAAALEIVDDPALPIADFASNHGIRRDFEADVLDIGTYAEACAHFVPIWERLEGLPFHASRSERAELTALRLAYSRAASIDASFAPDSKWLIDYALLGPSAFNRDCLEGLAAAEALQRRHFTRTPVCLRCFSARLLAFEACPNCGGSDLADEKVVHHYRCGWQAPETQFIRGRQLVCPKCHRELRHFGADYGKPGVIVHCRTCGASSAEPDLRFSCLDCTAINSTDQASYIDWYHYDITDRGLRALRDGKLPTFDLDLEEEVGAQPPARSVREFKLLAGAALRSAHRFDRPFSIVELVSQNMTALRTINAPAEIDAALRHALATAIETISECELVALVDGVGLLIGFPETSATDAEDLVGRVCSAIIANASLRLDFSATIHEGEAAAELLARH